MTAVARAAWQALTWVLLGACLAALAGALWWVASAKDDPAASIAGHRPYLVATGSMAPDLQVNSFVLTRETPFDEVEEGDVVAFRAAGFGGQTALHRVIEIVVTDGAPQALIVKGDNNVSPDAAPVTRDNYLGTVIFHSNATAFVAGQLDGPNGVLLVVVLPAAVLVLVWLGARLLLAGRRTGLDRLLVVLAVAAVVLVSVATASTIYLHQKHDHVQTTMSDVATRFESTTEAETVTVGGKDVGGTVEIPRIGIRYPVVDYIAASSLNVAITHFAGPALNEEGNVVLAGHRSWGNLWFTRIDELRAGDVIWVTGADRERVQYVVTGHREVTPDDVSVLDQPEDGSRRLTLISCTYDLLNRYIVEAAPVDEGIAPSTSVESVTNEAAVLPDAATPVMIAVGGLGAAVGLSQAVVVVRRRRRSADDAGAARG